MKKVKGLLVASILSLVSVMAVATPVDINTASASELAASIKGIGETKAAAIVAYRNTHGVFQSADELANVKGIGSATVEKNRSDLLLGSK